MNSIIRISNLLTGLCTGAARISAVTMVALVFVIMYDVIGRKFFATGSVMLQELEWHMHGVVAMLAFGFAYTRDAHVRIDVLADRMSARFRLWLELWVVALLVIPFFILVAVYGFDFAERAYLRGEGANGGRGLPHRWVIKSVIPISAVLAMSGCVAVVLRLFVVLRRPDLLTTPFIKTPLWKR